MGDNAASTILGDAMTLVGSYWQHVKRGSNYRVVADAAMMTTRLEDDMHAVLVVEPTGLYLRPDDTHGNLSDDIVGLPVRVQMSKPLAPGLANWVVYQSLDGSMTGQVWARPAGEFVDGRFRRIDGHAVEEEDT